MCENGRVVIAVALVALAVSLVHREQTGGVPPMKDGCTYTSSAGKFWEIKVPYGGDS